uniref:3-phosphoinositide-dependent protein kinase 1 n=1 Tax=Clastoptera arizonana TaxID=38151 RepID=A0A1B6EAV1_9HEMI
MDGSSGQIRVPALPVTVVTMPPDNKKQCNGDATVRRPQPKPEDTPPNVSPNIDVKRTPKDFIFGKTIGEGSFSTVYLAKDIHTSKEYAIKVCEKRHIIREKKTEHIKREKEVLNILSNCKHFFVKLYCTFQDTERLYFVLSYAKHGELFPHINKVGSLDIACTQFYAAEIVSGLEHLKRLNIVHRDLKPENILLDENMHILITDFGSAKIIKPDMDNESDDELRMRDRKNSFVGTAQYVSPELLTDKRASFSSDLWALGCIIYQMISGLPPFRSRSEYIIFKKIMDLDYEFPDGFCHDAKDLVQKLLVLDPTKRLGMSDPEGYPSLRQHSFFDNINWDTLPQTEPPPIYPYLPGTSESQELRSHYRVPDNLEPGLDENQLTRLLGLDLQTATIANPKKKTNICDLTNEEINEKLQVQILENKWHQFVEGNLIVKQGLVEKRKGLFARRRMLLLTLGPHLYYVDPVNMVLKGEIPWSPELRVEPKNFKIFFVHTPNRTYYLEDPEGFALSWCKAIDEVREHMYGLST